jgi:AbrB family looped-hinge helix DNA binding protein
MSSKGQVVIPEDIRNRLKLKSGSRFVVVGKDDVFGIGVLESLLQTSLPSEVGPGVDDLYETLVHAERTAYLVRGVVHHDDADGLRPVGADDRPDALAKLDGIVVGGDYNVGYGITMLEDI